MHCFNSYPNAESVAQAAAGYLAVQANNIVRDKGVCHIALPGGATPARCLELLALESLPWEHVHWYVGDERCLPPGHADRNDVMIRERLWSRVPAPVQNQHTIAAELGAKQAANLYARLIDDIGQLDIVVLGMGEDGHTASLFPGNAALQDPHSVVPVFAAPKPPPERVSLGVSALRAASQRIALVTGAGKREALRQIKAGAPLPINCIGMIRWFIDTAADAS